MARYNVLAKIPLRFSQQPLIENRPPQPAALAGRLATIGAVVAAGFCLAACSVPLADLPSPLGVPAGAPARPETQAAYPAVHDMPAVRQDALLEPAEQARLQRELREARDRQESRASVERTGAPSK